MNTPIKPPGGSPPGAGSPIEGADASRVDEPDGGGEFQKQVDGARSVDNGASVEGLEEASLEHVNGLSADLEAGRITADAAVDQLVARALETARGLPEAERNALEAQLREALNEDPALLALRKDLERASNT